jgi:hypothetical protein
MLRETPPNLSQPFLAFTHLITHSFNLNLPWDLHPSWGMSPHSLDLFGNSFESGLWAPPHEVRPLSTFHVDCRSVSHTLHPHSLTSSHLSLETHAFLFRTCAFPLEGRWKHLLGSGNISIKDGRKAWASPLANAHLLPCFLTLHLIHLPFPFNLKAHALIGWISPRVVSSLGCLTFVEDPRGVSLASYAIYETSHSLIIHHSSQYCYATKFSSLSLSLSLPSCFIGFVLEELGATLLLQPLPIGQ